MEYFLPGQIKKTIRFPKLKSKNVEKYEIYSKTPDDSYTSGIRTTLEDTIINPELPTPILETKELKYNLLNTWPLPKDIYLTSEYKVRVIINDKVLSVLDYTINKITKLLTIGSVKIDDSDESNKFELGPTDKIILEYYSDVIVWTKDFEKDCDIYVKPVFRNTYQYGKHNIIR